jgi:DNA-binding NarL/FixJ family response regulator
MMDKKTILVVDDHPLFREGLKSLIARNLRFKVIGEAGNGREALQLAGKLNPDVILMDISLPDNTGIVITRQIRNLSSNAKIIMVSMHSRLYYIAEAFRAGATGYVVKESAAENLLKGLYAVSKGQYFLDGALFHKVVPRLIEFAENQEKVTDARYDRLTSREQQIMRLLAEGLSTKKIAEKLSISFKTVENHRANIMKKLDVHSTMDLLRYSVKLGLIDVDLWKS